MRLLALMLAVFLQLFAGASAAERITDILGRSIDLAGPPQRVVLGDSLDFIFLSLLLDDPAAPIVGWAGADRIAASLLPLDRRRFPELDRIASLGDPNAGGFSVEAALALEPDVAVLGPGYTPMTTSSASSKKRVSRSCSSARPPIRSAAGDERSPARCASSARCSAKRTARAPSPDSMTSAWIASKG